MQQKGNSYFNMAYIVYDIYQNTAEKQQVLLNRNKPAN